MSLLPAAVVAGPVALLGCCCSGSSSGQPPAPAVDEDRFGSDNGWWVRRRGRVHWVRRWVGAPSDRSRELTTRGRNFEEPTKQETNEDQAFVWL